MHQKVHSAVLDKEKEHHIYTSMYIWFSFLKTKSQTTTKRKKKLYLKRKIFPFFFLSGVEFKKVKLMKTVSVQIAATHGRTVIAYCQCP